MHGLHHPWYAPSQHRAHAFAVPHGCPRTTPMQQSAFVHLVQLAWTLHVDASPPSHRRIESMALLSVPIIDLAPFFSGTPEGKAEVARKVDEACRSIGFLVITNHGIAP